MEYEEKIVKKKVVRDGKRIIKKTTDKDGYKMVDGKEVRMTPEEIRNRKKAGIKGAKKAKSKKSQTSAKRKRSMKKRPESFKRGHTIYTRIFKEGDFKDSWKAFMKSFKDIKDTLKKGGSYDQLEKQQGKLKSHLSDIKGEIKDAKDEISEINKDKKSHPAHKALEQLQAKKSKIGNLKDIKKKRDQEKARKEIKKLDKSIQKAESTLESNFEKENIEIKKLKNNIVELKKAGESLQSTISDLRDTLVSMTPDEKD